LSREVCRSKLLRSSGTWAPVAIRLDALAEVGSCIQRVAPSDAVSCCPVMHRESVRVAAFQAPLGAIAFCDTIGRIEQQVRRCESEGVAILCCPEGILGGLADYCDPPAQNAIRVADGELKRVLAPLRSDSVTLIVGFTELGSNDELYNSACVLHR